MVFFLYFLSLYTFSVMGGLSLLANLAIVHIIMQIALNFHRKKMLYVTV